jgi:hypothetical protein
MNHKNILITILLTFSVLSFGQSTDYNGLVIIKPCNHRVTLPKDTIGPDKFLTIRTFKHVDPSAYKSDTNTFNFYQTPDTSVKLKYLTFYYQWDTLRGEKLVEINSISWLDPVYSELENNDFCKLAFVCKKRQGKWLEVITNKATGETMWIEESKFVKFVSWNHLSFKNTWGITTLYSSPNTLIHRKPNQDSEIIDNPNDHSSFEIIKSKNGWIKVSNENGEFFNIEGNETPIVGWIRYKDNEKLLVGFEIK